MQRVIEHPFGTLVSLRQGPLSDPGAPAAQPSSWTRQGKARQVLPKTFNGSIPGQA